MGISRKTMKRGMFRQVEWMFWFACLGEAKALRFMNGSNQPKAEVTTNASCTPRQNRLIGFTNRLLNHLSINHR
tara:strand:+ start:501 stop:722 length:222 start_codon:yes stop_codon:yes gene_type:complete